MAPATRVLTTELSINFSWCKKCGICISFCPTGVFTADEFGKPVISSPAKCVECGLCVLRCPEYAVKLEPLQKTPGGKVQVEEVRAAAPDPVETHVR
jgi:2-oxoglutarate ferredoxin oxidoreductase subunit delta